MEDKMQAVYDSILYEPPSTEKRPPGPMWYHGVRTFTEKGAEKHIVYMYLHIIPEDNAQTLERAYEVIDEHDKMMNLLELINYNR